jgi:glycosyltransferase involved in cell wall biosynthesis
VALLHQQPRQILTPSPAARIEPGPAPTFSVVVAVYQAEATVADAIESALGQTLAPLEVVVVDDGSSDGTGAALEPYLDRITYVRRENGGAAAASNMAFAHARGDFVVILDADDVYEPARIEALSTLASARPDLDLLTTDAYLEARGQVVGRFFSSTPFAVADQRLHILERCFLACPAVRREALLDAGGFDESLRIGYDWECWIRLLHRGSAAGAVDEPLLRYRVGGPSLTSDRVAALRSRERVLALAARLDLSPDERFVLERFLRRRRRAAALVEAEQAIRERRRDARTRALRAALTPGTSLAPRAKSLAAAAAPGLAARRLKRGDDPAVRADRPHMALDGALIPARTRLRALRRGVADPREAARYLEHHAVRKLQIGSGPNPMPGWLNTDLHPDIYPERRDQILFLDAARPFPFADATFDYVFSEHQIEHVAEAEARHMLGECFRVLRPGGRIRVATPDLAAIVGLYRERLDAAQRHYLEWVSARMDVTALPETERAVAINRMFNGHGHQFIYDAPALAALLRGVGFIEVSRHRPGESGDDVLRGIESHGRAIGDEAVNRLETMALEAVRPAASATGSPSGSPSPPA